MHIGRIIAALAAAVFCAAAAARGDHPNKSIRLITPFPGQLSGRCAETG